MAGPRPGPSCGETTGAGPAGDRGAAIVDFVLVSALLTLVFVGVVQFAVVVHVRTTLVDCASEGARVAALAGATPEDGVARTRDLITRDLSAGYAGDVTAGRESFGGLDTVVVTVRAPLPVVGLLGVGRAVTVKGHAVAEGGT